MFYRVCTVKHEVFWAAPKDMLEDYLRVMHFKRKANKSRANHVDAQRTAQWLECLLPSQVKRLKFYRGLAPDCTYSLGQAPGEDGTRGFGAHSDPTGQLHTMINKCLPLWADNLATPRLRHPYEIAGAQGLYVIDGERRAPWPDDPGRKLSSLDSEVNSNGDLSHSRLCIR